MTILKGTNINKMLDLNATALKASIEMIMCLMRKETLYKEIKRVKMALKSNALN